MTEIEKLKKEIEDLKQIIESKNNQVESKNKHIKRLERIISNMKKEQSNRAWFRTTLLFYQFFNKKNWSLYYRERPKILDTTA